MRKLQKKGYWINRIWQEKCVQNETEAIGPEIPGRLLPSSRTSAGPPSFTHLLKCGVAMIPAYLPLIISFTLTRLTAMYIWWLLNMYLQLQLGHLNSCEPAACVSFRNLKGNMSDWTYYLPAQDWSFSCFFISLDSTIICPRTYARNMESCLPPLFFTFNIQTATKSYWCLLPIF